MPNLAEETCHVIAASWIVLPLLLWPVVLWADSNRQVDQLLQQAEPPVGVVFEIVTSDAGGLEWALPLTRRYIEQLRQRFPELPLAVVTHGREQFALQNSASQSQAEVHRQVQSITGNDIPVYVCGTYAGWRGLTPEDFPDYVTVAAAGPAQVNDYLALGYTLIRVHPLAD